MIGSTSPPPPDRRYRLGSNFPPIPWAAFWKLFNARLGCTTRKTQNHTNGMVQSIMALVSGDQWPDPLWLPRLAPGYAVAARGAVAIGKASVSIQQMASIRAEPTRQAVIPAQA